MTYGRDEDRAVLRALELAAAMGEEGMSRNKVRNTETEARDNPGGMLLDVIVGRLAGDVSPSAAIKRQEKRGQAELVQSDILPVDLRGEEAQFERLGFVLGEPVDGDKLFRYVTLPEGWKRRATDHAMWSDIVDEAGRVRVNVFYKAAFYDRKAHASLTRRFGMDREALPGGVGRYRVLDSKTGEIVLDPGGEPDEHKTIGYDECSDWMRDHRTDDVVAEWEAP